MSSLFRLSAVLAVLATLAVFPAVSSAAVTYQDCTVYGTNYVKDVLSVAQLSLGAKSYNKVVNKLNEIPTTVKPFVSSLPAEMPSGAKERAAYRKQAAAEAKAKAALAASAEESLQLDAERAAQDIADNADERDVAIAQNAAITQAKLDRHLECDQWNADSKFIEESRAAQKAYSDGTRTEEDTHTANGNTIADAFQAAVNEYNSTVTDERLENCTEDPGFDYEGDDTFNPSGPDDGGVDGTIPNPVNIGGWKTENFKIPSLPTNHNPLTNTRKVWLDSAGKIKATTSQRGYKYLKNYYVYPTVKDMPDYKFTREHWKGKVVYAKRYYNGGSYGTVFASVRAAKSVIPNSTSGEIRFYWRGNKDKLDGLKSGYSAPWSNKKSASPLPKPLPINGTAVQECQEAVVEDQQLGSEAVGEIFNTRLERALAAEDTRSNHVMEDLGITYDNEVSDASREASSPFAFIFPYEEATLNLRNNIELAQLRSARQQTDEERLAEDYAITARDYLRKIYNTQDINL